LGKKSPRRSIKNEIIRIIEENGCVGKKIRRKSKITLGKIKKAFRNSKIVCLIKN
jgi:hypothetical protein